jgi:hypothetical protein
MYVVSNPGLKLGARAKRVIEVCKAGGFVRNALERSYMGGEKFVTRVYDGSGCVVSGLGEKAARDAISVGALKARSVMPSSAYPSEFISA